MKRLSTLLFTLLLLCFVFGVKASHIVGGDLQLRHISNFDFRLSLNLYYDVRNSNFVVEDTEPIILLHIFRKSDNLVMVEDLALELNQSADIQYTNPNCVNGQLQTRHLIYQTNIELPPSVYNDPDGYYVVWERCCRNNVINNISRPGDVGMVFYLEFPPVVLEDEVFLNSTPSFRVPVGDYLCMNEKFTFDFGADDVDGDSLAYELTNPWIGNAQPTAPGNVDPNTLEGGIPAFPAPYENVSWLNVDGFQFSADRALPTDLSRNQVFEIDATSGLISVTPNRTGLFVFATVCKEYRNGKKIGEVRRDFQFFVLDCPTNDGPNVEVQANNISTTSSGGIFLSESDTLYVDQETGELCTSIWLKDPDMMETLKLRLVGVNFEPRQNFFSISQGVVNGPNDSLQVDFCWPQCLFSEPNNDGELGVYVLDLVVSDDRCPRSANDTTRLHVVSKPINNNQPLVGSNTLINANPEFDYTIERIVGETFNFDVFAEDLLDNDQIELFAVGRGFELSELGMLFENKNGIGNLESLFSWDTDCGLITDDANQFIIDFITVDQGDCENKSDTVSVELVLKDILFDDQEFIPDNAFSPNGDNINEIFTLNNLPEETCRYRFNQIEIFTRWGGKVFQSFDKNFEWDGGGLPKGVYYYQVDFNSKVYKGTITLFK